MCFVSVFVCIIKLKLTFLFGSKKQLGENGIRTMTFSKEENEIVILRGFVGHNNFFTVQEHDKPHSYFYVCT